MDRVEFKKKAKEILRDNVWYLCGIALICALLCLEMFGFEVKYDLGYAQYYVKILNIEFEVFLSAGVKVLTGVLSFLTLLYGIFVGNVIRYARDNIYKYTCLQEPRRLDVFAGFKRDYMHIVMVNLIKNIQIFLYTLLFIVPGIIKSYEYRFVNEILEEHPEWEDKMVLAESKRMTMNHKMDLFIMDLSFIGWEILFALLSIFTFGLASYCFTIYPKTTNAQAYLWLKKENENIVA